MSAFAIRIAFLWLLVAAFAPSAFAVNLAVNPSFAGNLNGWVASSDVTYDSANDATGVPGSGSAQSAYAAAGSSTELAIYQCIAAGPGTYTLGGKVLIPNGQAVAGSGIILVSFFSGSDCSTGYLNSSTLSTSTTGSFQTLSGPVTAPATTTHIWITGQNSATAAGTHVVNFDDFVLDNGAAPLGPPAPTPALGWLALLALVLAFSAMGTVILKR